MRPLHTHVHLQLYLCHIRNSAGSLPGSLTWLSAVMLGSLWLHRPETHCRPSQLSSRGLFQARAQETLNLLAPLPSSHLLGYLTQSSPGVPTVPELRAADASCSASPAHFTPGCPGPPPQCTTCTEGLFPGETNNHSLGPSAWAWALHYTLKRAGTLPKASVCHSSSQSPKVLQCRSK